MSLPKGQGDLGKLVRGKTDSIVGKSFPCTWLTQVQYVAFDMIPKHYQE